jgi:hypothetical protein
VIEQLGGFDQVAEADSLVDGFFNTAHDVGVYTKAL